MSPGSIMRIASRARPCEASSPDGRAALAQRSERRAQRHWVGCLRGAQPDDAAHGPVGARRHVHGRVTIDRHGRGIGEQRGNDGSGSNSGDGFRGIKVTEG